MNNIKQINYIKYQKLQNFKFPHKIIIFLHINYIEANLLQNFLFHCKENKIYINKFKLNFIKNKINNDKIKSLLTGPSLLLIMPFISIEKIFELQKKFNFFIILSFLFKNKFLNKKYIENNLATLNKNSLQLNLPSNLLFLFFFKRLNSLFINVINKPLLNLCLVLRYYANIKSNS